MRTTIRAILAIALLAGGLLAWASSAAVAGTFPVEACTSSVNYENHSLVFSTNNPTYIESHTVCGEPSAVENPPTLVNLSLGDTLGPGGVPVGAKGTWTFTAPAGTTISDVHGDDYLMKVGGNEGWNVYLSTEDTEGHSQIAQTCATSYLENECRTGGLFDIPGLKAATVTAGVECDAEEYEPGHYFTTCARGNEFGHAVRTEFDDVTVMLDDPTPPSNISGSSIPSGPQHGTITINGTATDTIAGLVSLSVIDKNNKIIGGPVTVPGGCDYSQMTPCPTTATSLQLPVNTQELPDGTNEIRVLATNAAHDQEASSPYTITVENHPTGGGTGGGGGTTSGTGGTTGGTGGTSGQGSGTGTNREEPPQDKTGGQGTTGLPPLPLKLTTTRVRHGELRLSGTSPVLTRAVVRITLTTNKHGLRPRKVQSTVRLTRHFRCAIRLPSVWRHVRATIEVLYRGSTTYRLTIIHRIILV
jgi:hypothetical protein